MAAAYRTVEREFDRDTASAIAERLGVSRLQAQLLAQRGAIPESAAEYLSPLDRVLPDPGSMPGVKEAAAAILAAARAGEHIVVFGDYDCDGVCATAIMLGAIAAVQCADAPAPAAFLPKRLDEGYGMTQRSLERMLADNPDVQLVVTVDNGINSVDEIAWLNAGHGVRTIVTDHHLPGDTLPRCEAIVNPMLPDAGWPEDSRNLCGAGVAFFIAYEMVLLARASGGYCGPKISGPMLVLAGIATVTDLMPLCGVNRAIVAKALDRFRSQAPIGMRELLNRASRSGATKLTSRDFGFLIGPRMNAAGRMADATEALELATTCDREIARECARIVDLRNTERKNVEFAMSEEALSQIVPGAPAQVISLATGHLGVAGIVASRVLERLSSIPGCVPAPVCVLVNGRGSARAPAGYNVRDAFAEAAEALERFGGHAAAGGVSVKPGMTTRFVELFSAACLRQSAAAGFPSAGDIVVDAFVSPDDLSIDFVEWLSSMEPFGEGNPEPVFAARGVRLKDLRTIGADGRHLQFGMEGWSGVRAVWWNGGAEIERLRVDGARGVDVAFSAQVSGYGGPHVDLRIVAPPR
jgi:single-stranded-DNA-specific exonuclease